MNAPERETLEVDVLFVGAGPATLASAHALRGASKPEEGLPRGLSTSAR